MYHYMEFDPYLIRESNQQIFEQVQTLRLVKRLRKTHQANDSQLTAFGLRLMSKVNLLRKAGLAGR